MLYLTRKIGESVVINDNIEVTLVEVRGKTAKIGFTFPPDATVLRRELYDKIKAENIAAAESTPGAIDALPRRQTAVPSSDSGSGGPGE